LVTPRIRRLSYFGNPQLSIITRALSLVKILFTFALMAAYTRL